MTKKNNSIKKDNAKEAEDYDTLHETCALNEEILSEADQIVDEAGVNRGLTEKEAQLQADNDHLKDQLLRAAADVQNIRRRADEDVKKARNFSIESFAKDLLSVMDSLSRAVESVTEEDLEENSKTKAIMEGVKITRKELNNVFDRNGVKCVNPVGEKFNHELHQAISQVEKPETESGLIVEVLQVGYTIKERLIRPALVIVVK
jgi:molecular chaperone GrpE